MSMPSCVVVMPRPRSPLMYCVDVPPDAVASALWPTTPGTRPMRCSGLRPLSGSVTIVCSFTSMLNEDSVFWTSLFSAVTVTLSSTPPGSIVIVRLRSAATSSMLPVRLARLKPCSSQMTE